MGQYVGGRGGPVEQAEVLPFRRSLRCGREVLQRYDEIARILTGDDRAVAADGVNWVQELCQDLQIPPLSSYGVEGEHIQALVQKASVASSMKANPIELTRDEMAEMLIRAL